MLRLYINRLSRAGAIFNKDPASLSKFQLLRAREAFRQDPPPQVQSKGAVEGDFAISLSLYHGYELLMQHGTRTLYHFLSNTVDGDKGFSRTRQVIFEKGLKDSVVEHSSVDVYFQTLVYLLFLMWPFCENLKLLKISVVIVISTGWCHSLSVDTRTF